MRLLAALLLSLLMLVASPAGAVVFFADGAVHDIDASNSIADDVVVANDPGGAATTVNVLSGGMIDLDLELFQDSIRSLETGAAIGMGVTVNDDAVFTVDGGQITHALHLMGNAQAAVNGGTVHGFLLINDNSSVHMAGGLVGTHGSVSGDGHLLMTDGSIAGEVRLSNRSRIDIEGGEIGTIGPVGSGGVVVFQPSAENIVIRVSGGILNSVAHGMNSTLLWYGGAVEAGILSSTLGALQQFTAQGGLVVVAGGSFPNGIDIAGNAEVTIADGTSVLGNLFLRSSGNLDVIGGSFPGGAQLLEVRDTANVSFYGSGFNYPPGSIFDLTGTLTGTLADGTPLSLDFERAFTASITLLPEPSRTLGVVAGLCLLAGLSRTRRASSFGIEPTASAAPRSRGAA
jgi:hypothetical protein